MAAVGGVMDESYADRAKKATLASNARLNVKQVVHQTSQDVLPSASSSTSETPGSSYAPSQTQPSANSLMIPSPAPLSSASSDQASPLRTTSSLPSRNAWTERSAWKHPQKTSSALNSADTTIETNGIHTVQATPSRAEFPSSHASPVKAASRNSSSNPDPFVVNYNLNPPSLTDAQSWPHVGDAVAPVTSPQRSRPSLPSVPSLNTTSGPQLPSKISPDNDTDSSPSKKSKGEKTKWVPISAKELQAAADEAARTRHVGPNAKKHSPRGNGRTRRLHDDSFEKQIESVTGRGEKLSPIHTGNTRHDRKASLNVPSSGSSRRVSPLQLSTNLPSPANNQDPSQPKALSETHDLSQASSPRRESKTTVKHANIQGEGNEASSSSGAVSNPVSNGQPLLQTESHPQNTQQQAPSVAYPPHIWPNAIHSQPFYPSYPVYPVNAPEAEYGSNPPSDPRNVLSMPRQKRKARPKPKDALPLAGYRGNTPEILTHAEAEAQPFTFMKGGPPESLPAETEATHEDQERSMSPPEFRGAWWSIGLEDGSIARWLKRHPHLQKTSLRPQSLDSGPKLTFFAPTVDDSSTMSASQIENAILQGVTTGATPAVQQGYTDAYAPSWPVPGTGPSALDIGLATGVPSTHRIPPPLYMGVSLTHPHMSPAASSPHPDWTTRNEPYAIQPPIQGFPYAPYPQPYVNPSGTENLGQAKVPYSDTPGRGRWREDRYPRGRGRGFSRGRGHRGFGGPRPYNSQYNTGSNANQAPHTVNTPTYPNPPTVYIPEPMLHPPYPYSTSSPSHFFSGYTPTTSFPEPATTNSQGRPPSPIPITQLHYPMEKLQYKLLGQIEYYFSHDNVAKDMYLREKMDSKGWVSISVLQTFPRIKNLNVTDDFIRETLHWSNFVEVRQNHARMAHEAWRNYILPTALESTIPDAVETTWYPAPFPFHPGYMAGTAPPIYGPPMQTYPFIPQATPTISQPLNGIASHILRQPEEKLGNGNPTLGSGTSTGDSFDSTPLTTEGEEAETSEDDVVFLIGEPQPMTRTTQTPLSPSTDPETKR